MKKSVIVAFSYHNHKKYEFQPSHVISDIRRIVTFSLFKTHVLPINITLLTDLKPNKERIRQLNEKFQMKAKKHLEKKGTECEIDLAMKTGTWLSSYKLDMIPTLHELDNENILEYIYLFCNYIPIDGLMNFQLQLTESVQNAKQLLLYFTCHGVSFNKNIALIIPTANEEELMPYRAFREFLNYILQDTNTVILFDCCYSEKFCPVINDNIIFIGSTLRDQTCGFYTLRDSKNQIGSLFTHFLLQELRELRTLREVSELEKVDDISLNEQIEKIEKQIISYRRKKFKSDQNIYLKTKINFFPDWLFSENNNNKINWS